jgi:tRNA(fMet)-specific endonuclease VapC
MSAYSLDTDIFTQLLKKHPGNQPAVDRFRDAIMQNSLFIICPVVFFEIRRELIFKGAVALLGAFEKLIESMKWKEFNAAIWGRASSLWSALRARGRSHHDADVLIAAHALEYGAVIVSRNFEHFQGTGVQVENWSVPQSV